MKIKSFLAIIVILNFAFLTTNFQIGKCAVNEISKKDIKNINVKAIPDEWFKEFAEKLNDAYVVYIKNKLVLFAHPKVSRDLVSALFSFLVLAFSLCPGYIGLSLFHELYSNSNLFGGILLSSIPLAFAVLILWFFLVIWKEIIRNIKMRTSAVEPHIIFDSIGLIVDKKRILTWKDIESVYFSTYKDKNKQALFCLDANDPLLPISYEQIKPIFEHCLSTYGIERFKSASSSSV